MYELYVFDFFPILIPCSGLLNEYELMKNTTYWEEKRQNIQKDSEKQTLKIINYMVMPSSVLYADKKRINSAGDDDKDSKHSFWVCKKLAVIP